MSRSFIYPWRIEGRQTAFHPWAVITLQTHIATAAREAERLRVVGKFYSTRVRAN